jgi:hypothetical protein
MVENQFQINNQSLLPQIILIKKPEQYRGDLEIKYTMSKKFFIGIYLKNKRKSITTPIAILRNEVDVLILICI